MPANLISPCSGLSDTQSNVPYGTRKRNPLAATVADSMSRAMARDCDRWRMVTAWSPSSQFRLSTLATVPVRIPRLSSNPVSPVTSLTAWLERDLHLGKRRNRHPQRQLLVQHVILADVSVSEDVIAELLLIRSATRCRLRMTGRFAPTAVIQKPISFPPFTYQSRADSIYFFVSWRVHCCGPYLNAIACEHLLTRPAPC